MAEVKQKKVVFVNPYAKGVSYEDFVKALGNKTVSEYCKGKLSKSEIEWISKEIEIYKENKKITI